MAELEHDTTCDESLQIAVPLAPVRLSRLTALRLLLSWQLARASTMLPIVLVVQALLAVGIIVGFGFLVPSMDVGTATYLSTGAPTVLLITVGLVVVPQQVATARLDGTWDYLRSLPVPRLLLLVADLLIWLAVALPGLLMALAVAWWRYDVAFSFDLATLLPATVLAVTTATAVGYAIAVVLPPQGAMVMSQVLVFFVLLFSPLTFRVEQLPDWFQRVHEVLPVQAAGDAIRSGLAADQYPGQARDLLVLATWCSIGVALTMRALTRRD